MNLLTKGIQRALSLVLLWAAVSLPAQAAREVHGISFDDQLTLADQRLVLNGLGVRSKMIIKVYAMALYVPRKESSVSALLNQSGAKSVRIVMLRSVSSQQLAESMVAGVQDNASPAEQGRLQARLDVLQSTLLRYPEVPKGTAIQLDYLPDRGTRLMVGGKTLGPDIAGEDFYRALLKIWLGENPSDSSLKRGLLGVS